MKASCRLALSATAALAAMVAVSIVATDAVLRPTEPGIVLVTEAAWVLRSTSEGDSAQERAAPIGARVVRLVYPALIEPR